MPLCPRVSDIGGTLKPGLFPADQSSHLCMSSCAPQSPFVGSCLFGVFPVPQAVLLFLPALEVPCLSQICSLPTEAMLLASMFPHLCSLLFLAVSLTCMSCAALSLQLWSLPSTGVPPCVLCLGWVSVHQPDNELKLRLGESCSS